MILKCHIVIVGSARLVYGYVAVLAVADRLLAVVVSAFDIETGPNCHLVLRRLALLILA